jgi:hypothetical protein
VGFEVLSAVAMKIRYKFYLLIFVVILLGLSFDPEDGGNIFLQHFSSFSKHYTASCPRL